MNNTLVIRAFLICSSDVAILFQHIYYFIKVGGVFEKFASAELVKVVLPDIMYLFGAYFVEYPFSLDRGNIHIA